MKHYGRMCFKSVNTLESLHSQLWKRPQPSALAFSTAENVELLEPHPIHNVQHVSVSNSIYIWSHEYKHVL